MQRGKHLGSRAFLLLLLLLQLVLQVHVLHLQLSTVVCLQRTHVIGVLTMMTLMQHLLLLHQLSLMVLQLKQRGRGRGRCGDEGLLGQHRLWRLLLQLRAVGRHLLR